MKNLLKTTVILWGSIFFIIFLYFFIIQVFFVWPFIDLCNSGTNGKAKDIYLQEIDNVTRKNKHINFRGSDEYFISFDLNVPYIPVNDYYECNIITDENEKIFSTELNNY